MMHQATGDEVATDKNEFPEFAEAEDRVVQAGQAGSKFLPPRGGEFAAADRAGRHREKQVAQPSRHLRKRILGGCARLGRQQ